MKLYCALFVVMLITPTVLANEARFFYEQALQLHSNAKLNEAEISVKNSIRQDPNYLPARILLGEILLEKGQALSAEKELKTALSLNADISTVIILLAKTQALLNKHQEIIALLDSHQSLATDPNYFILKANAHKALGQNKEALKYYELALSVHGANEKTLTGYADLLLRQNKGTEAQQLLTDALSIAPNFTPAHLLQAELYKQQGKFEQALAYYQKVVDHDKANEAALLGLAYLLSELNRPQEAVLTVTRLREISPNNPYAKLLHASIIAKQGNNHRAQTIIRDIQQQILGLTQGQQSESEVLLMSAGLAYADENYHQAKRLFARYIDNYGESVNARKQLAAIALQLGEPDLASYHIDYALKSQRANAEIYLLATHIYQQTMSVSDFHQFIEKAHRLFPHNSEIKKRYALALLAQNKSSEAIAIFQNTSTDSLQSRTFLAYLLLQENELALASDTTQALLNEFPNKVEIQQLAAELSVQLGNADAAQMHFEQALRLAPKFRPAQLGLAGLRLNAKDLSGAITMYKEILKHEPNDALTLQLYADAAIKLADTALAIELLSKVANDHPDFQAAQRALLALYIDKKQIQAATATLEILEQFVALDPELLVAKAQLQLASQRFIQAQKTLKVLYGIVYDNPVKLGNLADLQINARDFTAARTTINRIEQLGSNSHYLSARLALATDDLVVASTIISNATVDDPAWLELSTHLLAKQGKSPQAIENSLKLFQLTKAREHLQLTTLLMTSNGEPLSAIRLLNEWLHLQPNDNWARAQLSQLADKNDDKALAMSVLEESPSLHEQPLFMNNLANMYQNIDIDKALAYARKANQLAPQFAAINDTLGWILAHKQQYKEALGYLREAVARDANNANYHFHLAFVLLKLNRISEARVSFDLAKSIDPSHELVDELTHFFVVH
mgnify:CR=1 FL=1